MNHRRQPGAAGSSNNSSHMYLTLRLWTLLACCLASLALRQDGSNSDADAGRRHRRLSFATPEQLDLAPPEQLHLALAEPRGRDVYAMSISWYTPVDAQSRVFWGPEETLGKATVRGNSTRYTTHHTNLNLDEFTSGVLHSAVLEDLEPSSTYFYRVGDADLGLSTIRNFTTPGALGAEQPLVLGILGDLGQTNDSRDTLDAIMGHEPAIDLVLHAGDLSYADCKQERWDSFMRLLDSAAACIPWMVAAGNHEIEAGSTKGGPFTAFEHRFRMPSSRPAVRGLQCGVAGGLDGNGTACGPGLNDLASVPPGEGDGDGDGDATSSGGANGGTGFVAAAARAKEAIVPFGGAVASTGWPDREGGGEEEEEEEEAGGQGGGEGEGGSEGPKCCPSEWSGTYDFGNSFYSFDVASVHVVVLNPYTATGEGSLQHSWLIEDLNACDRSLTPWLVAMFHCPWYNSNLEHPGERMAVTAMRAMEPVLFQHRASLTISGHVHAYERSLPVLNGELNEGGLVNVVVGASGNNEGPDPDYYRVPGWSGFRNGSVFGFGTLSVMNSTMAFWEWKSNDGEPAVLDSAWIYNNFSPRTLD